jgi:hypothetical protein
MSEDAPNNRNLLSNEKMWDPKRGCDIISVIKAWVTRNFKVHQPMCLLHALIWSKLHLNPCGTS